MHAGAVAIRKRRKNQNKKEEDIDGIVRQTKWVDIGVTVSIIYCRKIDE